MFIKLKLASKAFYKEFMNRIPLKKNAAHGLVADIRSKTLGPMDRRSGEGRKE